MIYEVSRIGKSTGTEETRFPPGRMEMFLNQSGDGHTALRRKVKVAQSCLTLCNPMDLYSLWNSPGQNTGPAVGSLSFLQGIFPTQGSNPGLPHCRQILYQLSCKGSPQH